MKPSSASAVRDSDLALVTRLTHEIDRVFATLIRRGERVALVNFPNHGNAGDSAIWLGELACLRRLGVRVAYRASWGSYRRAELARALGSDGTILLHGGGNFGDLYPHNQATTRERVLADFPRQRTIQLPQSIWFRDAGNRDRLRRLCEAHADFTLMVREAQSLELARAHFAVPTVLCPDMAFALGMRRRVAEPEIDILWLARTDPESTRYPPPASEPRVSVVDWLEPIAGEPVWPLPGRVAMALNRRLHALEGPGAVRALLATTFAPLARRWVNRGCRILARGRVVVTDRFHGHILSILQGIPHVVLDNSYGKNRSLFDTWTHTSSAAHWAATPEEALDRARALVENIASA